MGARGAEEAQPPAGPAFLVPERLAQLKETPAGARRLGLQVDMSVSSSWDVGGHWIEPPHASMGLFPTELTSPAGWRTNGLGARIGLRRLWTIAEATLNGRPLGIAWTAPFTLDASAASREGGNELVVEIVNTWHNRLVADAKLPPGERATRTNITVPAGQPWAELDLLDSGLCSDRCAWRPSPGSKRPPANPPPRASGGTLGG